MATTTRRATREQEAAPRGRVLGPALLAAVLLAAPAWGQSPDTTATVDVVSTVGCAVRDDASPPGWRLTRAAEPSVTDDPYTSQETLDAARTQALGSRTFGLVGVAEYLSEEDRQALRESGNQIIGFQKASTGQLRDGHRVAIRGLLVEVDGQERINLTSVVSLDPTLRLSTCHQRCSTVRPDARPAEAARPGTAVRRFRGRGLAPRAVDPGGGRVRLHARAAADPGLSPQVPAVPVRRRVLRDHR